MMSSSLRYFISSHTIGIFIGACPPLNDLHSVYIKNERRQDRDGKYVWYELIREGGSYMTS